MRHFKFESRQRLPESLLHDPVVLELVHNMEPRDVFDALVQNMGLQPSDAALTAGALIRHANDAMAMPVAKQDQGSSSSRDMKNLSKLKKKDETFGMSPSDSPIPTIFFPEEEEESEDWPYDAATKGIMSSPLAAGPRMTT